MRHNIINMQVKIGCDIVHLGKFKKSVARGGEAMLGKIFTSRELAGVAPETLAGIFAAKEAVIKALGLKAGDWHKIEISRDRSGRPEIKLLETGHKIAGRDLSISHDGEYVLAAAVFIYI